MRTLKAIIVLLMAMGRIALLAQAGSAANQDQPAFSLSIRATQSAVKIGEPVNFDITLTNISNKPIGIQVEMEGDSEFTYDVFVDNRQGSEVPYTPYMRAVKSKRKEPGDPDIDIQYSTVSWIVQPGKSLTTHMDIARLYKIEKPGEYTVWVERLDRLTGIRVKSNTVSIAVDP